MAIVTTGKFILDWFHLITFWHLFFIFLIIIIIICVFVFNVVRAIIFGLLEHLVKQKDTEGFLLLHRIFDELKDAMPNKIAKDNHNNMLRSFLEASG